MLIPYKKFDLYHLSYPKLTVIVTSGTYEKGNALAVSWHTYLSFSPPLYGISIAPTRYSYKLIKEYGEFAVNFLPLEKAKLVWDVGGISGRSVDKFEKFNIKKFRGKFIKAPLIEDSIAIYECKVIDELKVGDHVFIAGEIKYAWIREDAFKDGLLNLKKVSHVYYLGEGKFIGLNEKELFDFESGIY